MFYILILQLQLQLLQLLQLQQQQQQQHRGLLFESRQERVFKNFINQPYIH